MRAAGYVPLVPYPGTNSPWLCRCASCGRESTPRHTNVRQHGARCVHCSYLTRHDSQRTPTDEALAAMRAGGFEPFAPYPGNVAKPWPSRCGQCGRDSAPTLRDVRDGHGCRRCADDAHADARRRSHDEAAAIMRAGGAEPLEPYRGHRAGGWSCRCLTCGGAITPTLGGVLRGQGVCVLCARAQNEATWGRRYAGDRATLLYLLARGDALKVGITTEGANRLRHHESHGWEVCRSWQFRRRGNAARVEHETIAWWRRNGWPAVDEHLPQGGATETVSSSSVDLARAERYIDALAEFAKRHE